MKTKTPNNNPPAPESSPSAAGPRGFRRPQTIGIAVCLAVAAAVFAACVSEEAIIAPPPQIAGATLVGSKTCEQCHEQITKTFPTADHARLMAKGSNAAAMGCESCHGAGSKHNESGGARGTIINPRRSPETCFQCHLDKRGNFSLPYHHPLEEGKVTCADCHNPHSGRTVNTGATSLNNQNDICFKCHTYQRGPFVFQHEALREGCTTCHNPHGTVNQKMLVVRNQNLCLQCHFQQQTSAGVMVIGNVNHAPFVARGTCWSGGCHEAVHGSNINQHLRY